MPAAIIKWAWLRLLASFICAEMGINLAVWYSLALYCKILGAQAQSSTACMSNITWISRIDIPDTEECPRLTRSAPVTVIDVLSSAW